MKKRSTSRTIIWISVKYSFLIAIILPCIFLTMLLIAMYNSEGGAFDSGDYVDTYQDENYFASVDRRGSDSSGYELEVEYLIHREGADNVPSKFVIGEIKCRTEFEKVKILDIRNDSLYLTIKYMGPEREQRSYDTYSYYMHNREPNVLTGR